LNLQQISKYPGLVRRFLHGHQVLDLTEGHHPFDPILWASILEDSKLLGVLGIQVWVVWINERFELDPFRLVRIRPINFVHLLHLGNKRNRVERSCAYKEAKRQRVWKTYSCAFSGLKFFNRSLITVLYVKRTIAIYDLL
jgi:hypothetical protein